MERIAVNVVLLPDQTMTDRAIEINRRLITTGRPEIVLNTRDCLPHISLAMGCLEEADMKTLHQRLENLASKTDARRLRIIGLVNSVNSYGETTVLLQVENKPELQTLHEQVMEETRPFFRYDVTEAMIHDDAVMPSTLEWIRTYPEKAGYDQFDPHITIGYGQLPAGLSFPIPFTVTRLAVCHLGNHCTCRKVMGEWNVGTME